MKRNFTIAHLILPCDHEEKEYLIGCVRGVEKGTTHKRGTGGEEEGLNAQLGKLAERMEITY